MNEKKKKKKKKQKQLKLWWQIFNKLFKIKYQKIFKNFIISM